MLILVLMIGISSFGVRAQIMPKACPIYIAHELHSGVLTTSANLLNNSDCPGGSVEWPTQQSLRSSDDQYSELALVNQERSQCLWLHDLDLNIPPGSVIEGIRVDLEGHQIGSSLLTTRVQLTDDLGQRIGMNQSAYVRGDDWPQGSLGRDGQWWYGGDKDDWDVNLTSDMVNNTNFGVLLQIRKPLKGDTSIARLDQVRVTVYFTPLFTICHDSCTVFYVDEVQDALAYHWDLPADGHFFNKDSHNNVLNLDTRDMDYGVHQLCVETESTRGRSTPCCMSFRLAQCESGSVGDFVWSDDGDGIQNPGEQGISGIPVTIYNAFSFANLGTVITDSLGNYRFNNIPEGHYFLEVDVPTGFNPAPFRVGTEDEDSDFDQSNGPNTSRTFFVASGGDIENIDGGFITSCSAFATNLSLNYIDNCLSIGQAHAYFNLSGAHLIPLNFVASYLLIDEANEIIDISDSPDFAIDNVGNYRAVAIVYNRTVGHPDYIDLSTFINTGRTLDALRGFIELIQVCASVSNEMLDFDVAACGEISGYVWHDVSENGLQDPNELGIGQQVVTLLDANNFVIDRDTTDLNGQYQFVNLQNGTYNLQLEIDTVYEITQQNVGANDDIDSDFDSNGATTILLSGSPVVVDGGLIRRCEVVLGGINDLMVSDDCLGIDSISLTAHLAGNPIMPAGYARYFLLSKDGWIEAANNIPEFAIDSISIYCIHEIIIDTLAQSPHFIDIDQLSAGLYTPDDIYDIMWDQNLCMAFDLNGLCVEIKACAVIGDLVWLDINENGTQEAQEVGIDGIEVKLFNNVGSLVETTITTSTSLHGSGYYQFTDVPDGQYYLQFVLPAGLGFSLPNIGNDEIDSDVTGTFGPGTTEAFIYNSGSVKNDIDAGVYAQGNLIGNRVWKDDNSDGLQDVGEVGINDVEVELINSLGQSIVTTVTSNVNGTDGIYEFHNVPVGVYYVKFILPEDYFFTKAKQGFDNDLDSDVTGINGEGTTDYINVLANDTILSVDAGLMAASRIGDYIWLDENANGEQDLSEIGVNGIRVGLFDAFGSIIDSTMSGPHPITSLPGFYEFDQLAPGPYFVRFDTLSGMAFTNANAGGNEAIDSDVTNANGLGTTDLFNLLPGQNVDDIDAGYMDPDALPATIGDYVWLDRDNDGIQDGFENGINGVNVYLYDKNRQLLESTITDYNPKTFLPGYYRFDSLRIQEYFLVFEPPHNHEFALSFSGLNKERDSDISHVMMYGSTNLLPLYGGENKMSIDAGFIRIGSIGDIVWHDINADGIQDPDEYGMNDIVVNLFDQNDNFIEATITQNDVDGNPGYYVFNDISPGGYYLQFVLPPGYKSTIPNAGGDDTRDSDVNDSNGEGTTAILNISPGEHDRDADCGFYMPARIGQQVWLDNNFDGIQGVGEEGVPDVKVLLYNDNDEMVAETVTDYRGLYKFEEVDVADYYLKFVIPDHYLFTLAKKGRDEEDSDVTNSYGYGTTAMISLESGQTMSHIDAGVAQLFVLSVDMDDFSLIQTNDIVELTWKMRSELNVQSYWIERRGPHDDRFEVIKEISALDEVHRQSGGYKVLDKLEEAGEYAYRIRFNGWNNDHDWSPIKVAVKSEPALIFYPNPTKEWLYFDFDQTSDVRIEIYSSDGLNEIKKSFAQRSSIWLGDLPSGVYLMKLTEKGNISWHRIVLTKD